MQSSTNSKKFPPDFGPTLVSIGNFDGVHRAHSHVLKEIVERARQQGAKAMAVTFEPHPVRILRPDSGLKLITPTPEKLRLLEASGLDAVLLLPFGRDLSLMTPRQFAEEILKKQLHAREVHEGYNFHFGHKAAGNVEMLAEFGREMGFEVKVYPEMKLRGEPVSSSQVRKLAERRTGQPRPAFAGASLQHALHSGPRPRIRLQVHRSHHQPAAVTKNSFPRMASTSPALASRRRMLRFGHERGRPSHVWGGVIRGRNPSLELSSHRTGARHRSRDLFPAAPARRNQVSLGGSAARTDRARRAQSPKILPAC